MTLLGTSPSEAMAKKLIADYWFCKPEDIELRQAFNPDRLAVFKNGNHMLHFNVIQKGKRFRFTHDSQESK